MLGNSIKTILANGSCDSFARIVVFGSKRPNLMVFLNCRKSFPNFFCERVQPSRPEPIRLSVLPLVFDSEVLAVAVVEVAGLLIFGVWRHEV